MKISITTAQIFSLAIKKANRVNDWFNIVEGTFGAPANTFGLGIEHKKTLALPYGTYSWVNDLERYHRMVAITNNLKELIDFVKAIDELDVTWVNDLDPDIDPNDFVSTVEKDYANEIDEVSNYISSGWTAYAVRWLESQEI